MPTECSAESFDFGTVEGRCVEAAFDAGLVISDAGALLLGATDRAIRLMDRFASCFHDERHPQWIEHEVTTLVGQRVFGIAVGYEDLRCSFLRQLPWNSIPISLGSVLLGCFARLSRSPWLLREIVPLINQSPKLQAEVDAALDELNKSVDEITCSANQLPGQWNNLAGMRVAPYACDFTTKWLSINATVIISGSKGEVYDTITPAAIEHADKITETNPIWRWSPVKPTEEPVLLLATPSVPRKSQPAAVAGEMPQVLKGMHRLFVSGSDRAVTVVSRVFERPGGDHNLDR
jgi:hypothetical protein